MKQVNCVSWIQVFWVVGLSSRAIDSYDNSKNIPLPLTLELEGSLSLKYQESIPLLFVAPT